jgi:hypothetical protein
MGKFLAKVTGEMDGYTVSREFAEKHQAVAWAQKGALSEFEDQPARGEVFSEDGHLEWQRGNLMTPSQATKERDRSLARSGLMPYKTRNGRIYKLKKGD